MLLPAFSDGAPFELFLAADEEFPNRLTSAGLTRDAGVIYAEGRLVIFAPAGSPLTVDADLRGLESLVRAGRLTRSPIMAARWALPSNSWMTRWTTAG